MPETLDQALGILDQTSVLRWALLTGGGFYVLSGLWSKYEKIYRRRK
jgi:hypothetical protein